MPGGIGGCNSRCGCIQIEFSTTIRACWYDAVYRSALCCSILQDVAVCCSYFAVRCRVL